MGLACAGEHGTCDELSFQCRERLESPFPSRRDRPIVIRLSYSEIRSSNDRDAVSGYFLLVILVLVVVVLVVLTVVLWIQIDVTTVLY